MNKKLDLVLFVMGLIVIALFILGIGNVFASPTPTTYSIKSDNTNTLGYVLVGTGKSQGSTQIGTWESISDLEFVSADELNKEIDSRIAGDNLITANLNNEITARKNDISKLTDNLNAEANVRYTTDSQLQTSISTEQMRALVAESNITNNLNNEINSRTNGDAYLQYQINNETYSRAEADDILQSGIDSVKSDLSNESIVREKADNTLQDNINTEQFDRIAMVNNEAISRSNADNLLQSNINSEASTRASADNQLNRKINDTNSRVDNVEHRLGKLERTQYVVRGELKFIREKHLEVGVYSEYNVGRSVCSEVGLNVVVPIGESYLDRENKAINTRLDRLERNLGQSTVITKVLDKNGKQKSISISQGQVTYGKEF